MDRTKTFLGHPVGLFVLFFTEMWERFSYYGMRALLVLYMTQHLFVRLQEGHEVWGFSAFRGFLESMYGVTGDQGLSSHIYGLYTGLVYFTPVFGGIIADRYWGHKRSIYVGGLLMMIGHFLMAIESMFLLALFFLIIGNGFFKPNISSQVGNLYPKGDHRRDGAFTIFYMGINLGAFFSPLICGTLGQVYGWHYGFAAAGIGMIAGLVVYHFGKHHLPDEGLPVVHTENHKTVHEDTTLTREDYVKIAALVFLCAVNIVFWAVYEQQGNVLQIWADQSIDWNVFGWQMPSTWFQSFNPLMIFIFAPILVRFWNWSDKRKVEPTAVMKMAIGCFLLGIGCLVLAAINKDVPTGTKLNMWWSVLVILLFTIGELYISPIGLSLVTKLAPRHLISMLMGVWLLSSFFGNNLTGIIGSHYESMGQIPFFNLLAWLSFGTAAIFFVTSFPLKKIIPRQ